jgi:hypothetical protein
MDEVYTALSLMLFALMLGLASFSDKLLHKLEAKP